MLSSSSTIFDDQGDFAFNGMRIRQLFDFTDRTGTIVFDVDAKVNPDRRVRCWWVELFITDDPAPMPYHEAPGVIAFPKNGIGFCLPGLRSAQRQHRLEQHAQSGLRLQEQPDPA